MFGHTKAEYFSAATEGTMIFVAAVVFLWTSVDRFLHPQPLENVGIGLLVAVVASAVNGAVAVVLLRAGRTHRSVTLRADGHHLLTDVWTSVGVVVGVLLVGLTGWERLDAVVAFVVGINIIVTGWKLLRTSAAGLMDVAWEDSDQAVLAQVVAGFTGPEVSVHGLRTRQSGRAMFAELHVVVPGAWSVRQAHTLADAIEAAVANSFCDVHVITHVEPDDDPAAQHDVLVEIPVPSSPPAGPASSTAPAPERP